jgi:TolB-like protein
LSWKELKERRLVQIVVSYAVGGWVAVSILGEVIDRGVLPEIVYRVALVLYFGGMVAAVITGWYHGEKGQQEVTKPEVALLSIVGLITVGFCVQTVRSHLDEEARRMAALEAGNPLNNLAVLYFQDLTRGEDLTYLADGLTEALIDRLSESQSLTVLSRNASAQYRDASIPIDSIGKALEVGTVVDGTVERRSDDLRVTFSLFDAWSGQPLQEREIERPFEDLFALQDELVEEVAVELGRLLAEEVDLRDERRGTESVVAWTLFQRGEKERESGLRALDNGDTDEFTRAFRAADSLYAEAERDDPEWALPLIRRGLLSDGLAEFAAQETPGQARSWVNAGMQYVERALGLNPRSPEAFYTRGKLKYLTWRYGLAEGPRESEQAFQEAMADLREATDLDPSFAEAYSLLSLLFSEDANNIEANLAAQRAYEEDEFLRNADEILFRLYATSYDLELFPDAETHCATGRRRFPRQYLFRECRLWLMEAPSPRAPQADPDLAWDLLESYLDVVPRGAEEYLRLKGQILVAGILGKAELPDSANAVLSRSRASMDLDPEMELLGLEALIRLHIGEKEESLRLLRTYLTANPQHREGWQWTAHWWWRPLQDDSEFRSLVEG